MPHDLESRGDPGVSRRSFIKTVGVSAAGTALAASAQGAAAALKAGNTTSNAADDATQGPGPIDITLRVNGANLKATIDPATTLLECLRINLGHTGSKEGCDRGACGACSVHIDGKLAASCMMLAIDAVGSEITTIEGLAKGVGGGMLDTIQEHFIKHDAMQCGYCIPGFVMAARAMFNKTPKPTLDQIKHDLSGNICRCGCYTNMFNACLEASGQPVIMDTDLPTAARAKE